MLCITIMNRETVSEALAALRQKAIHGFTQPISKQQTPFHSDVPAKGPMWISRVTLPSGGTHEILHAVEEVIQKPGDGSETYDVPDCVDVKAEWVGYRSGVEKGTPEPKVSEEEKYRLLIRDVEDDTVMLYAHGGARLYDNVSLFSSFCSFMEVSTALCVFCFLNRS